jgi:hypothetical protein
MKKKLSTTTRALNLAIKPPRISMVLTKLLQDHRMKLNELSTTLKIPYPTLYQLVNQEEAYPRLSTLLPIARFFKITLGQFVGEEPLGIKKSDATEFYDPWNWDLFLDSSKLANQLFEQYKIAPNSKVAMKLISDIYHYSIRDKREKPDEAFADWCVSQYAKDN